MHTESNNSRRNFLTTLSASIMSTPALLRLITTIRKKLFDISIAEWSLHKALFAKKITNLDFPIVSKKRIQHICS